MHVQISRCYWCPGEARIELEEQPKEWVLAPGWYQIAGNMTGEYCSWPCLVAAVLNRL